MGLEARCDVTLGATHRTAKVHLDSSGLQIAGTPALRVPLEQLTEVTAANGVLRAQTPLGPLAVTLGPDAEKWARQIQNPKSRLDKLGVAAGAAVVLLSVDDADLTGELERRGCSVVSALPPGGAAWVFLGVRTVADLEQLHAVRAALAPSGAVWVIRPKGKQTAVPEGDVRTAAAQAGLVDVKVVAFSSTHSADKLVIPLAQRG